MKLILIGAAALSLFPTASYAEPDKESGNYWLAICKSAAEEAPNSSSANPFNQGVCTGIVLAVFDLGEHLEAEHRFCPPRGATVGQALRVTVKYLESQPQRLHRNFISLTTEALSQAWPCK